MSQAMTSNEYLSHVLAGIETNPHIRAGAKTMKGVYLEATKLELHRRGLPSGSFEYEYLKPQLDRIRAREDCAEFGIPAMVRMLKEYRDLLPAEVVTEMEETLVGFRYWLDEPGEINACYFTENHQPLYHSAEYLVGAMFPDRIFPSNGKDGRWHMEHGRRCLERWTGWRETFGFSEWLTNYYAEDIIALLGVIAYGEDRALANRLRAVVDTMMFDIAVNTFRGHWIGSAARVYALYLVEPSNEAIGPISRLYWGEGSIDGGIADCAIMMAIYDYEVPEAIVKAARDPSQVIIGKERMSVNTKDAKLYGVDPADFENIMFFWGLQVYDAVDVIENSSKVMIPSNWMNERINAYKEKFKLHRMAGLPFDEDPDFTAMTQVDLYTYKTPDYAVNCAQDFRKGKMGYQQHIWGANLGGRAKVFTNHPGSMEYWDRPNMIAGNSFMPRAAQHENVVLCVYRVPADHIRMLETHAYFPQHEFDEIVEKDGWVFGRKDNGYIALGSLMPAHWKPVEAAMYQAAYRVGWEPHFKRAKPSIYHANGHANVWVAELGSKAQNGSFEAFIAGFEGLAVEGDTFGFAYNSPSQGKMTFGWDAPLTVKGEEVSIVDYPRYDNPYCQAAFPADKLVIRCDGSEAVL